MASPSNNPLLCVCHIDGNIVMNDDRSISYQSGRFNGFAITYEMRFDEFSSRVRQMFGTSMEGKVMKYTTNVERALLFPLTCDAELHNMLLFNERASHVYIVEEGDELTTSNNNMRSEAVDNQTQCMGSNQSVLEHSHPCSPNVVELAVLGRASGSRQQLISSVYDETILNDKLFNGAQSFRQALYCLSISQHFEYRWVRNTKKYMDARCAVEGCPWRVTCRQVKGLRFYRVKRFENEHKHGAHDQVNKRPLVRTKWIAGMIREKMKFNPEYLPRQICKDFELGYDMKLTYHQSWHIKERAKKNIDSDPMNSYKLLPWKCDKLMKVMPGTVALYTSDDDGMFRQLFIAYHCSLHGFRSGCRPMLFIDSTHLFRPYQGTILAATAIDANNQMYPVAYGAVSSENHEDWLWFFENLKSALAYPGEIVIVSNHHPSIIEGVSAVFGSENHAHCLRDLKENFSKFLNDNNIGNAVKGVALDLLEGVARARFVVDFEDRLRELNSIYSGCSTWVYNNAPEYWANCMFPKKRWDKMSSNIVETFNEWIGAEKQLSIMSLVEKTHENLGELLWRRHEEVANWNHPVGSKIENEIKANFERGHGWIVSHHRDLEFEVETISGKNFKVELTSRRCSCKKWDMIGIPCEHACQAIESSKRNVYDFVEPCFLKDAQMRIYSELMCVVDNSDMPSLGSDDALDEPLIIRPPNTKRPVGRPRTKRIEFQFEGKRVVHCSQCNEVGHNRKSCRTAI